MNGSLPTPTDREQIRGWFSQYTGPFAENGIWLNMDGNTTLAKDGKYLDGTAIPTDLFDGSTAGWFKHGWDADMSITAVPSGGITFRTKLFALVPLTVCQRPYRE